MLKFRKMHDKATGIPLTTQDDDRFTRIGRWLAKRKLDELPQLWHLITGEMSLVGPRPETGGFVALQRAPGLRARRLDLAADLLVLRPRSARRQADPPGTRDRVA